MLIADKLIPKGRGLAPVLLKHASTIELDWDVRQKSRFDTTDSRGRKLAVFLGRGQSARGGDVLVAQDGSLVRVIAAAQPVLVVRQCAQHGTPLDLMRAAYHLGNRHVQLELAPTHLKLEPDHVLADMLRQMHLIVSEQSAAFEPEAGAYSAPGGHAHDTSNAHGHPPGHDHSHVQVQRPDPGPDAAHQHGHHHGPAHPHPKPS